jgi:hypothetical protein
MTKVLKSVRLGTFLAFLGTSVFPAGAADLTQVTGQGKSFTLTTATAISYGANNIYTQRTLQPGVYGCNDATFGDPIPGVVKACYTSVGAVAPSAQLTVLIGQNGFFSLSGAAEVSYGANGVYSKKTLQPGTYACTDQIFGDPIFGVVKACYTTAAATTTPVAPTTTTAQVAAQNNSFTLSAATVVSYGANGSFNKKSLAAGTYSCTDQFFGDPIFGVVKACYTATSTAVAGATPTPPAATAPVAAPAPVLSTQKPVVESGSVMSVAGDVVVNGAVSNAEYQAMAQKMGTEAGVAYRYGPSSGGGGPAGCPRMPSERASR